MEYRYLNEREEIYNVLLDFEDVFPDLKNRISNLSEYAQKLKDYADVYVGIQDNENVGLLVFYANDFESRTAYISLIGIKEAYRYMNFGKQLLFKVIELSRKRGMKTIRLEVDNKNEVAKKFYQRNGFGFIGNSNRDSQYMEKQI